MQVADVLRRDRESKSSPQGFHVMFFIKDNWMKVVLSLILSVCISVVVRLNLADVHSAFSGDSLYGDLIYVLIGAVPEWVLQRVKKKFGITQPGQVNVKGETFKRK